MNYFPSRFDPVRHAEKYPIPSAPISGRREKAIIVKENNFQQPGARFRSWDPARQDRFIGRLAGMLSDPRVTQVWAAIHHNASPKRHHNSKHVKLLTVHAGVPAAVSNGVQMSSVVRHGLF